MGDLSEFARRAPGGVVPQEDFVNAIAVLPARTQMYVSQFDVRNKGDMSAVRADRGFAYTGASIEVGEAPGAGSGRGEVVVGVGVVQEEVDGPVNGSEIGNARAVAVDRRIATKAKTGGD